MCEKFEKVLKKVFYRSFHFRFKFIFKVSAPSFLKEISFCFLFIKSLPAGFLVYGTKVFFCTSSGSRCYPLFLGKIARNMGPKYKIEEELKEENNKEKKNKKERNKNKCIYILYRRFWTENEKESGGLEGTFTLFGTKTV